MTRNVWASLLSFMSLVSSGIGMQDLFDYLQTVPPNQKSVHDIHYMFTVPDIYKECHSSPKYNRLINPVSYDIILSPEIFDGLKDNANNPSN